MIFKFLEKLSVNTLGRVGRLVERCAKLLSREVRLCVYMKRGCVNCVFCLSHALSTKFAIGEIFEVALIVL